MLIQVNESKFNMWRACVAILHLDGHVSVQEHEWFDNKLKTIPFTEEQKQILREDLKNGLDIDDVFEKITHPPDRAFLLHQLRVLAKLDGAYTEEEQESFQILHHKIMEKLNPEVQQNLLNSSDPFSNIKLDPTGSKTTWFDHFLEIFRRHLF